MTNLLLHVVYLSCTRSVHAGRPAESASRAIKRGYQLQRVSTRALNNRIHVLLACHLEDFAASTRRANYHSCFAELSNDLDGLASSINLSRDQNSFLPVTLQRSIFTLRHGGDSESAFKNTPIEITIIYP